MEIGIETSPKLRVGLPHNMQGPTLDDLSKTYNVEKQSVSDFLDVIAYLESKRENIKQEGGGPGSGYYQLETGSSEGGYTRLEQIARDLPKELTPSWAWPAVKAARKNDRSFDASMLNRDQQNYLMASYILLYDRGAIENFQNAESWGEQKDIVLNYWVDRHWAGYGDNESLREEQKAKGSYDLNVYKRNKDWASDMLAPEFNIDNMYYG